MKKLLASSILLVLISTSALNAQTIIYDDFSNPNVPLGTPKRGYFNNEHPVGTSVDISGRSPSNGSTSGNFVAGTNLPGSTWLEQGGNTDDGKALEVSGSLVTADGSTLSSYADVGYQRSVATIGIGSYNTSPILTLSAYVRAYSSDGSTSDNVPDGAFLGFSSASGKAAGILLSGDGSLTLDVNSAIQNGNSNNTTIAYSGANPFVVGDAYLLSFTIDTSSGNGIITNISLQGSTANYSALEAASGGYFTSSALANVQLGTVDRTVTNNQGGGFYGGEYGNLTLTAGSVPEPSTWALMLAGSLVLSLATLRRRQQS